MATTDDHIRAWGASPTKTKKRVAVLEARLQYHRMRYYLMASPVISDVEYDAMEALLKKWKPTSHIFSTVGAPVIPDEAFAECAALRKAAALEDDDAAHPAYPLDTEGEEQNDNRSE